MSNKRNKTNIRDERIEDSTLYGEFIPSLDQWTSSERQRERARYLQEVTVELAPGTKRKPKKGIRDKKDRGNPASDGQRIPWEKDSMRYRTAFAENSNVYKPIQATQIAVQYRKLLLQSLQKNLKVYLLCFIIYLRKSKIVKIKLP